MANSQLVHDLQQISVLNSKKTLLVAELAHNLQLTGSLFYSLGLLRIPHPLKKISGWGINVI